MKSPFDYVNAILQNKQQLIIDKETEDEYIPFIVNRALSFHKDCIIQANEINKRHFIDKKMQNDFLINSIRGYKRPFVKWIKPEKNDDIELIRKFFGYSYSKARDAIRLIDKEQILEIKEKIDTGGL